MAPPLTPQGAEESEVLFTLIAERYERGSLGITSNLVFSEWEKVFANPMAFAPAIDRIVHHTVILAFDTRSYRPTQPRIVRQDRSQTGKNNWRRSPLPRCCKMPPPLDTLRDELRATHTPA